MYIAVLVAHNLLRWLVIILAVGVIARAWSGWLGGRPWTDADGAAGRLYTISMDVQLVLGLLLFAVLSDLTRTAFGNMGAAMADQPTRFFVAEHPLLMVLAVVLAHVGSVLARRGATDAARHRRAALWYTGSFLLLLAGIPWWRPRVRLSGG
ncbi:MAG TPA: hypothetical protein VFY16_03680 [Gemmatimonadaceae bacterium]|nr:hypothetical protein [Gemmatimonadaceae bacterium]